MWQTSVFLAQIIGLYFGLVGLAMFFHQARFKKALAESIAHQGLLNLSGSIGVILGLLVIMNHNVWVPEWPILITIIGWLSLVQGVFKLMLPDLFGRFIREVTKGPNFLIWSWVWLILGAYLIWIGWTVSPTL